MYAVLRRYANATKLIEEMDRRPQEVESIIGAVPGFVAYHAIRTGDTLVTISVCQDQTGTEETTRRAAAWVRENVGPGVVGAPDVTSGEVFINFGTPQTVGAAPQSFGR
jgi:hypothetical protein